MLLSLFVIGISLSVILLNFNAKKFPSSIYLAVFFLLISLYCFAQYALFYSKSVLLVSILYTNIGFLCYLIGPLLYWYVRSVLTDNYLLHKKDFWHLLPMLFFLITTLPHIFLPYPNKVGIAAKIVEDSNYMGIYNPTLFHEIIPVAAIFLSRPVIILGYTVWSAGLFIRHFTRRREALVFSRQNFMASWMSLLLGFLLILVSSHLILIVETFEEKNSELFYSLNFFQILSGIGLVGLLISPFFFPRILYGLPRFAETSKTVQMNEEEHDSRHEEVKRHNQNLESEYLHFIGQKADSCMKELHPYLQPDFNLTQLSVQIHIPVHHLSYYFREEKRMSFNDYRNRWRINHAENLIREGKASGLTLEAIGLQSGFSNRNSFRKAFEKVNRISPSTFTAQI